MPKSIKDVFVDADLDPFFRRIFWVLTTIGGVLLAAGIFIEPVLPLALD